MGGTDEPHNISYPISIEDHIIWHLALKRMFPGHKNQAAAQILSNGNYVASGPESPNWKGGISLDMPKYHRDRRDEVRERYYEVSKLWEAKNKDKRTEYQRERYRSLDPEKKKKRQEQMRAAATIRRRKAGVEPWGYIECDCGCNRTWDPGNYAQHKKRMEKKNVITNNL